VPFREPHGHIALDPDLLSRACVAARPLGAVERYAEALFRAVFVDGLRSVGHAVCVARAGEVGLDPTAFAAAFDGPEVRAGPEAILRRALGRGAFGVPTFVVGDPLFWAMTGSGCCAVA
jgi:2-hydroxychromene-2-carboxylate isomerase